MEPIAEMGQAFSGRDDWETTLGNRLLDANKVSRQALNQTLSIQSTSDERLGPLLVRLGILNEQELGKVLADMADTELVAADAFPAAPVGGEQLSTNFLREGLILPLADDGRELVVAMADPGDDFARQAIATACDRTLRVKVAAVSDLRAAIERLYGEPDTGGAKDALDLDDADIEQLKDMASEAPVVRFVNNLIDQAVQRAASDVHIEPFEHSVKVRYRIDGELVDVPSQPPGPAAAVVSRVKLIAKLNIAERRLPQDGRIQIPVQGKPIDMRVSTIPTLYGESVVLRILDKTLIRLDFEFLGYEGQTLTDLRNVLSLPHGVLLVTGPTGSGKSTTLYAALQTLNTPGRKLITVEDPVEYQLEGVNQIQVKPQIGLSFANALRSIMRQDPDVIMIGEMRDTETARIAVQSALTGHVVLSTLHTNDAGSSITRLLDMGVEDYLLTSTVNAVLAQRLVRRLCTACRQPVPIEHEFELEWQRQRLPPGGLPAQLYHPLGCDACARSGFRGRVAITELLLMSDPVRQLVLDHADGTTIQRTAVEQGMETLFTNGLRKVAEGVTAYEEIVRATQDT